MSAVALSSKGTESSRRLTEAASNGVVQGEQRCHGILYVCTLLEVMDEVG